MFYILVHRKIKIPLLTGVGTKSSPTKSKLNRSNRNQNQNNRIDLMRTRSKRHSLQPKAKKKKDDVILDGEASDDNGNGGGDGETMVLQPSADPSSRCRDSDQVTRSKRASLQTKARKKDGIILDGEASDGGDGNGGGGGEMVVLQPSADPSPCCRDLADPVESTGETNGPDEPASADGTGCSTKVLQRS